MSDALDCVIGEILSRLPAKSLLRFRCVCKAWRALFSDPYFIRKHLSCINTKVSTSYSLLVREQAFRSVEHEAILNYLSQTRYNGRLPTRRLRFPVLDSPFNSHKIEIVGSCNGLICLVLNLGDLDAKESYTFMLWNPCTGESNVLPQPPFHFSKTYFHFFGFGYVSTIDDYKVLLGSCEFGREEVVIFTLKTGSWRKVDRLDRYFDVRQVGCLVNEALHWLIDQKMVSFDLAEEKFHEIQFPYPPIPVDEWGLIVGVGVLNNCLILYFQTILPPCSFKMWLLRDYGVKESWTEVVNIRVLDDEYTYITCISEKGEVLMRVAEYGSLALYNPKEKVFRIVMDYGRYWYETATYLHTLVSPLTGSGASV